MKYQIRIISLWIVIIQQMINIGVAAEPGDSLIWTGIKAWYNYDTGESVAILDSARQLFPENPVVHLVYAAARYQHSQAVDPVAENYRILNNDLAEVIPIYEQLIEQYPQKPVYRLYYGSAIGLKARIHLGRKEWIRTLWYAYKGFSIIRMVADENPDFIDAQLPIGIVEYYAGLSGGLIKFGAGLFGLEPSLDTGRTAILRAAAEGDFSWMEANGIISYLYLYIENKPHLAFQYAERLVIAFPGNWYYRQLLTHCQLTTGDLESGFESLQWLSDQFPALPVMHKTSFYGYLHYEWAFYHFLRGDYFAALQSVNLAIEHYDAELDAVLANALLLKGQLLDIEDNRVEAVQLYQQVIDLDNFCYAIKLASTNLNSPYQVVK